jgi:DNA-binding beta-propeller fold protein YncE
MKITLRKSLCAALLSLCALVAIGGALLISPGMPGDAKSVAFKGYVLLPKGALLTAKVGTVIDPATRSAIATIPLGGKPEFAVFDPQTNFMYQNLQDGNSVVAVDLGKKTVGPPWPLGKCRGPSGIAIDEKNRRLFIVCSGNSVLVIFDIDKQREIQTFPIGGGPDSVVFDAGLRRIYTTGKSGVLVIFQQDSPDGYHLIDSVNVHYGAHTLAVDSTTHFVYVGYASLGVRPRVAVFQSLP